MGKVTISTLDKKKAAGEKFVCITAYDATFARVISEAGAEAILVGDSLGQVVLGHESTIPVRLEDMIHHTRAVRRLRTGRRSNSPSIRAARPNTDPPDTSGQTSNRQNPEPEA